MAMTSELHPLGESLKPLKQTAMNPRLPKRMVLSGEKTLHDGHSPSAAMVSADDGTIRMSRGKTHCKSPFLACQLLVFFASVRKG
jgi:hypothetical protein